MKEVAAIIVNRNRPDLTDSLVNQIVDPTSKPVQLFQTKHFLCDSCAFLADSGSLQNQRAIQIHAHNCSSSEIRRKGVCTHIRNLEIHAYVCNPH